MTQQQIALKTLRVVHGALVLSVLLYSFVVERIAHSATPPGQGIAASLVVVAAVMILIAVIVRQKTVRPALEKLQFEPDDLAALQRWRSGSLVSLILSESVALYGVALRVLGLPFAQTLPFYLAALLLMAIWTPCLDSAS